MLKKEIKHQVATLFGLGSFLAFYFIQVISNWPLLKSSGILGTKRFVDLFAIQDFATRVKSLGFGIYHFSENGSGYQYSIGILYVFDLTRLSIVSRNSAAMVLEIPLFVLLATLLAYSFRKQIKTGILAVLLLASPGVWLLFERGNLDILMVLLIAVAGWTFKSKYEVVGYFALVFSVLTKFYTAPLLILYVIFGKKRAKLFYVSTTTLIFILTFMQISKVKTFPSTWYVSFGSGSIAHWINLFLEYQIHTAYRLSEVTGLTIGIFLLGISALVHLKVFPNFSLTLEESASKNENLADFFALTFLACYAIGMNYDYRLIIPILAVIFFVLGVNDIPIKQYLITISILSGWLSCYFFGLTRMGEIYFQLIGDIFIGLLASYFAAYYFHKYTRYFKSIKRN